MLGLTQHDYRNYNIEGLKRDYYSIKATLHNTKNKKERRVFAGWLARIKETLEELGEEVT